MFPLIIDPDYLVDHSRENAYIFGHYDSRGGTTAIVADTVDQAFEIYNNELFHLDELIKDYKKDPSGFTWNPITDPTVAEEDFLYKARLINAPEGNDTELLVQYTEREGGEVWIRPEDEEKTSYRSLESPVDLLWLPATYFEGPEVRTYVGFDVGFDAADTDLWPKHYKDPQRDEDSNITAMLPTSMHRVRWLDGSEMEFKTDDEDRCGGWKNTDFGEDAFGLILMRR